MQTEAAVLEERSEHSFQYQGWGVVLAAAGCIFVSFGSLLVYTFSLFLKPLASEFGWSREAVSAAFSFAALAVAACSPILGSLFDRFPARRIILPCMVVFGTGFASLSLLTDHLWQLYGTFLLLGIVGNGTAHLAYTRALSTWFKERRGAAFALLMTGGALGSILLPLLTQALISAGGWRTAFAVLGGLVLAVGLPLGSRIRERRGPISSETAPGTGLSTSEGLRTRAFWIIVTVLFFSSLAQNGALAHISALLTDRGISMADAALAASVLGGTSLIGRLVTGWFLDRYSGPRVAFGLIASAALGTFLLASAHSMTSAVMAAAFIGLGMGGEADVTPYLLTRYFGLRSFSTLYGFSWTIYAIAAAIGPFIMGRAFDLTGSYETLLARLAVVLLLAGALMLLLPKYREFEKA